MADKMYESLQVLLVVLSDHYPTDRRGGGGMSVPRKLGRVDLSLIIVSMGKVRKGRLSDLACLGMQNLLEFEGQMKKDLEKKNCCMQYQAIKLLAFERVPPRPIFKQVIVIWGG